MKMLIEIFKIEVWNQNQYKWGLGRLQKFGLLIEQLCSILVNVYSILESGATAMFIFVRQISSMMFTINFVMTFLFMLQPFLHNYCKQEFLDLSLTVKMSLSKKSCHDTWMFFKLFVVDFYQSKMADLKTDFQSVPLKIIIP